MENQLVLESDPCQKVFQQNSSSDTDSSPHHNEKNDEITLKILPISKAIRV